MAIFVLVFILQPGGGGMFKVFVSIWESVAGFDSVILCGAGSFAVSMSLLVVAAGCVFKAPSSILSGSISSLVLSWLLFSMFVYLEWIKLFGSTTSSGFSWIVLTLALNRYEILLKKWKAIETYSHSKINHCY